MAKHPAVGEQAPDFELDGTDGPFKLSEHRGERVMLLFYPADDSSVCTKQFCSYRDNAEAFGALGVTAVGISGKDVDSKRGFSSTNDLNVPLLADPELEVAKAYGAFTKLGKTTKRAVVIVETDGTVAYRHDHALGLDFQTVTELREALDSLPEPV